MTYPMLILVPLRVEHHVTPLTKAGNLDPEADILLDPIDLLALGTLDDQRVPVGLAERKVSTGRVFCKALAADE